MKTLIKGGTIVNEGKTFKADLVIENDRIAGIPAPGENTENYDVIIDATGQYIIPGVIDDQVHFRESGTDHTKGNIAEGSRGCRSRGNQPRSWTCPTLCLPPPRSLY